VLKTADTFADWNLRVVNQIVPVLNSLAPGR